MAGLPLAAAAGTSSPGAVEQEGPSVPLLALDTLWFQVTGTICNLRCSHCFISCAPDNHAFGFLSLQEVEGWLEESRAYGVRDYYYTGGEPFMHADLPAMIEKTLALGPVSILTNGTVLPDHRVDPIARAARESRYSVEMRVSIDGPSPEMNDPVRGEGTFDRAMAGVRKLLDYGFLPIITAAQVWPPERDEEVRREFMTRLRGVGYDRPRLKILPRLKIGREQFRDRGYGPGERVTLEMMEDYDEAQLLCSSSRIVTSEGIFVCPILIERPAARMGYTLKEASRKFGISHKACYTCWLHGAICSNYGAAGRDAV